MLGGQVPGGRAEIGETVASFPSYEAAQKTVSSLISREVPARDIAIVGYGLRSVERITGRLGWATAARSGAVNGVLLGLFFSALFVFGNASVPIQAFVGIIFVGIAVGMLLSILTYALVRRRRDFASVMQVIADHYDVTVLPGSIHRARELVGTQNIAVRPHGAGVPDAAPVPSPSPAPSPSHPPRYGERVDPAPEPVVPEGDVDAAPPRYGERVDPAPEPVVPEGDLGQAEPGRTA